MLASPGPWRLEVAVALRSRSPQTAAELARSGSNRFYSILVEVAMPRPYSLSNGGGLSKVKVCFSVSSQSILNLFS